jgi:hypothetical protein
VWTPKSCDACTYDTPRSLIRRTASSLNSRVNSRLSKTHLRSHEKHLTRCLQNLRQAKTTSLVLACNPTTLSIFGRMGPAGARRGGCDLP